VDDGRIELESLVREVELNGEHRVSSAIELPLGRDEDAAVPELLSVGASELLGRRIANLQAVSRLGQDAGENLIWEQEADTASAFLHRTQLGRHHLVPAHRGFQVNRGLRVEEDLQMKPLIEGRA